MKNILKYKQFENEENFSDIEEECRLILIDLIGDGLDIDIKQVKNSIRISIKGGTTLIFCPYKYMDNFDHLNNFLNSEGYIFSGNYYKTYEKWRKDKCDNCKETYLSYLGLNYEATI